jgi:hypothetical protein
MSIILSFDVGVINLSYCLLTKKKFIKDVLPIEINNLKNNELINEYLDWDIIEWNNIDLTDIIINKCDCGNKANLYNIIDDEIKYYCKIHARNINIQEKIFDDYFIKCDKNIDKICQYKNICNKKATYNNCNSFYCSIHAKLKHKNDNKNIEIKEYKKKKSTSLNFDDVKFKLISELEKRKNLLNANYVVIENQPSFKNPRMKSIASTLYDYYLIRGIIDKQITKSNIIQVKFMSPSNKLKLINDNDNKELVKVKNNSESKSYKLTKNLSIKYCSELINHLPNMVTFFNSNKKKDDLADSFLQGIYFYTNNC